MVSGQAGAIRSVADTETSLYVHVWQLTTDGLENKVLPNATVNSIPFPGQSLARVAVQPGEPFAIVVETTNQDPAVIAT